MRQLSLIPEPLPPGFSFVSELITPAEEQELVRLLKPLPWQNYQFGEYTARRQIVAYGMEDKTRLGFGDALPDFILPFRERIAVAFNVEPRLLSALLFTYYPAGSAIGWHSDGALYERVFGLSLLGECKMDFRLQRGEITEEQIPVLLERRGAYAMTGPSRRPWQHRIANVGDERYSITFRTLWKS